MVSPFGAQATAARAHEELFAYWASRREAGRLPGRAAIHPAHFKRHLPTVSLIDVSRAPRDYRLRLAGTGLYGVYGREITGRTLDEIYSPSAAEYWQTRIATHPLGTQTLPVLEQAGRLEEVRNRVLDMITTDWTTSTGEVRLKAQYLLATATR